MAEIHNLQPEAHARLNAIQGLTGYWALVYGKNRIVFKSENGALTGFKIKSIVNFEDFTGDTPQKAIIKLLENNPEERINYSQVIDLYVDADFHQDDLKDPLPVTLTKTVGKTQSTTKIYVTVTDLKNKPVTGLLTGNFTVYDAAGDVEPHTYTNLTGGNYELIGTFTTGTNCTVKFNHLKSGYDCFNANLVVAIP
jgi:hypothetical protein